MDVNWENVTPTAGTRSLPMMYMYVSASRFLRGKHRCNVTSAPHHQLVCCSRVVGDSKFMTSLWSLEFLFYEFKQVAHGRETARRMLKYSNKGVGLFGAKF